jgi:predicted HTH transcriptional regulator
MNKAGIKKLIRKGEGISIEFKECRNKLNKDVFESICAFLNRNGGDLILGVNDKGKITGIASLTPQVTPEATPQVTEQATMQVTMQATMQDERIKKITKEKKIR